MPIYAYKCSACGHAKDVLQKMSDPVLTDCPQCGAKAFSKQVTAAGFQLKGSGWYVTDFRSGSNGAPAQGKTDAQGESAPSDAKTEVKTEAKTDSKASGTATDAAKPAVAPAPTPAAASATPGAK